MSQEDIYLSKNANLVTFPNSQIAIFGNIINDSRGGFSHINYYISNNSNDAGNVFLFRNKENGNGNSRIYGGPNAEMGFDNFNTDGSYCRFWNLITDNILEKSIPSNTLVNEDFGSGNIQIEQEVKVNNSHYFKNGIIWTPRSKWNIAFVNYENLTADDSIKIIGVRDSSHIDGYVVESGNKKSFFYPVGDGKKLRECGILKNNSESTKAAYFNNNPLADNKGISGILPEDNDTNNLEINLTKISNTEFWDIDATSDVKIYLSVNNNDINYSNWYGRFSNSNNIIVSGFDGKWRNLGFNKANISNNGDTLIESSLFKSTENFSLYTWAEIDTNIMSVNTQNLDNKYIKLENSIDRNLKISFSFGYQCVAKVKLFNILGNEVISQNIDVVPELNFMYLRSDNLFENHYFIQIISDRNEYLFYKFLNLY